MKSSSRTDTVVHTAWVAAGRPLPTHHFEPGHGCSRCGATQELTTSGWKTVISPVYSAFDDWTDTTAPIRLCVSCTWAFRSPGLRDYAHLVEVGHPPRLTRLTSPQLGDLLARGPLDGRAAVWVPLRRNRKHCVTHCQWGMITVDDIPLSWSVRDSERLVLMRRLRALGFGPAQLASPSPHFGILTRHPPDLQRLIMRLWPQLDAWRRRRPWLELALRATAADVESPAPTAGPATGSEGIDRVQ